MAENPAPTTIDTGLLGPAGTGGRGGRMDAPSPGPVTHPLIVVINDDPAFLELVKELLEDERFQVEVRRIGTGAYQFVKDRQPALVILDVRLGDKNGWDVCQALVLDPATRRIPILVCSAAADELRAVAEQVRRLGGDVLRKPFALDALVRKVEALLGLERHSACNDVLLD
jgi:DNA-binding response OmpR family regulator